MARDDISLFPVSTFPVYFSNSVDGNSGVMTWQWTLLEKPPGSAIALINPTSAICELRPDVYGTYVVSLSVNGMSRKTNGYSETIIGCRYDAVIATIGNWRAPAFLEKTLANWFSNWQGAQPEIWKFMDEVRNYLMPWIGWLALVAGERKYELASHLLTRTDQASPAWVTVGYLPQFQFTVPWNKARFKATLLRNGVAGVAKARLYDVDHLVAITNGEVTTNSGDIDDETSNLLTIGVNPGNLRNDVVTRYRVDIEITGGTPGVDFVELFDASIYLYYF